jgi:hypothetical protein
MRIRDGKKFGSGVRDGQKFGSEQTSRIRNTAEIWFTTSNTQQIESFYYAKFRDQDLA